MKTKLFIITVIIAMLAFGVVLARGDVWAQQDDTDPEALDPKSPIDAKFSNDPDKKAAGGAINGEEPGQMLQTKIPDDSAGTYPKNDSLNPNYREVDAVANRGDAAFGRVIANTATLLISIKNDTKVKGYWKVWYETSAGNRGVRWNGDDFNNPDNDSLNDLDGLQLYGGAANRYSEQSDPVGSVLKGDGAEYVPHADIVAAVTSLGWNGVGDIDLDALMVWDRSPYGEWSAPDTIIFSIRAAGNWDGGEIVVLPSGGTAFFLVHGRHEWNTAFNVRQAFGVDTEEVDAIEAYPTWYQQTPTLTQWGLVILVGLLILSTVFVILRRRKGPVPA